jgi:ABC-type nitrate/sulfonate/bicarbonate transport system substrate-binding protein
MISALIALTGSASVHAAGTDKIAMGGGISLSVYVAQTKGFYAEQNIEVTIPRTSSSNELRDWLANGKLQVAAFGVDNALTMSEQKAADVAIIMDLENPPVEVIGQKGMKSVEELRGKVLLVDSPDTQNAVIMKRILAKHGLEPDRDYTMKVGGAQAVRLAALEKDPAAGGTVASWPEIFNLKAKGYPTFGSSSEVLGQMTFQAIFARRDWLAANKDLVERFLTAQLKAQRFIMDPKNKDEVIGLYAKSRNYNPEVATAAYEGLISPIGWVRDGEVKPSELAALMKLRAEVEGSWGGNPPPPETYIDLSYLHDAIEALDKK